MAIEYRPLRRDEIELIWKIDRREYVTRTYHLVDSELALKPLNVDVPGWDPDNVCTTTPLLYQCYDRGGRFFSAFEGERIVGVAVLDTLWRGERRDLLQLEFLHVGRDHRGGGIGSTLFERARTAAKALGARGLYISATPSENTIHFYQRRGASVLRSPDPELFAMEPEDIHLECPV